MRSVFYLFFKEFLALKISILLKTLGSTVLWKMSPASSVQCLTDSSSLRRRAWSGDCLSLFGRHGRCSASSYHAFSRPLNNSSIQADQKMPRSRKARRNKILGRSIFTICEILISLQQQSRWYFFNNQVTPLRAPFESTPS